MTDVCKHGHLRRACQLCELTDDTAALRRENAELRDRAERAEAVLEAEMRSHAETRAKLAALRGHTRVAIDLVRAEGGGYCIVINDRRVCGAKPLPVAGNVISSFWCPASDICDALAAAQADDGGRVLVPRKSDQPSYPKFGSCQRCTTANRRLILHRDGERCPLAQADDGGKEQQ